MDGNRRFSEREVALVLRKATEMEEVEGPSGSGLSLEELEQIAGEVGISPAIIRRAVAELDRKGPRNPLMGAPLSHEAIRAVAGELGPEGTAALIAVVERGSDQVGEVTEALGTTRWTARDRFGTTQVAITSAKGGTTVRVVERASARLKRILHAVPAAWGVMLGIGVAGATAPEDSVVLAALLGGGAVGAAVGRFIWQRVSAARTARVERLAAELALEAANASRPGEGGEGSSP